MTGRTAWNPAREVVDGLPRPDSDLARLASALLDGSLTRPERDRLEAMLEHADARRAFRKLSSLHANLLCLWHEPARAEHRGPPMPEGGRGSGRPTTPGRKQPHGRSSDRFAAAVAVVAHVAAGWLRACGRPVPLACLVAGIVMVAGLAGFALVRIDPAARLAGIATTPTADSVAFVADVHGVRWSGGRQAAAVGDFLAPGARLEIAAGLVEVMYFRGARVVVEGPASFSVTGPTAARLDTGRIVAKTDHPPQATASSDKPWFTVLTPRGVIDDLGTEFGVNVPRSGDESVHVFEGLVDVRPLKASTDAPTAPSSAMRLSAGQTAGLGGSAGVQRLAAAGPASRFTRRLPEVRDVGPSVARNRIVRVIVVDDAPNERNESFVSPTGSVTYFEGTEPGYHDATEVASLRRKTDGHYRFWEPVRQCAVLAYTPAAAGTFRIMASWGAGFHTHCRDAAYVLDADGDPATTEDQTRLATVDQRLFADGSGDPGANVPLWSGFRDLGTHSMTETTRLLLVAGAVDAAVTADAVLFIEQSGGDETSSASRTKSAGP